MPLTRRLTFVALLSPALGLGARQEQQPEPRIPSSPEPESGEDHRLPNGKSQKDAISKQAHEDALKEVESLIRIAEDLRGELKNSGQFVVAISSVRKTEEIEKLARQIRGKLKA